VSGDAGDLRLRERGEELLAAFDVGVCHEARA
jgi:hypothetical protein